MHSNNIQIKEGGMKIKKLNTYFRFVRYMAAAFVIAAALFFCHSMIYNINQQMNASATTNLFH